MSPPTDTLTILLPLDGSRLAEAVLPAAEALSRHFRARVSLVHAIEKGTPATIHGERHLAAVAEAEAYLEDIAERLRPLVAEVSCHVHEEEQKDVAKSIVEHADEIAADLILMCSHGRGGVRDLLFGSIAQQVVRWGRHSVMLMRPRPGEGTPAFGPRRILVPLDGTAEHEPALPTALRMARAFGADLRALLVIPTRSTVPGEQAQSARALPGTMKAVLDLAEQGSRGYLEETLARCREAGVAVSGEILRGDPVPTVVEQASAWGADLVVLASHGRRGLDALFSGSVAPRLTGLLDRPLILVKAARAAEAAREG